jgi:hypothetical protein
MVVAGVRNGILVGLATPHLREVICHAHKAYLIPHGRYTGLKINKHAYQFELSSAQCGAVVKSGIRSAQPGCFPTRFHLPNVNLLMASMVEEPDSEHPKYAALSTFLSVMVHYYALPSPNP